MFKNFFLFILSTLLTKYEESFSACATYHFWLHRWLSYCLSSKHKPHCVLSCFVWRPFFPEHSGCLPLCCSCYASICGDCCHIFCMRKRLLGVGFCLLTLEFCSQTLLFVMCTSRKFLLLTYALFFLRPLWVWSFLFVWRFLCCCFCFLTRNVLE